MDSFINLAKQGYQAYSESHSDVQKTGGQELNSPHHSQQTTNHGPQLDEDEIVKTAQAHGSGDSSMFSSALQFLGQNKSEHHAPIDEEQVTNAHKAAYEESNAGSLDSGMIGSAAALQVLKQFTSGGSEGKSQNQLVSLAMAEASQLFDKAGSAGGDKQDAVNGAAMTVMKMLVQSKMKAAIGGGDSGGLSGLMSMASKFM